MFAHTAQGAGVTVDVDGSVVITFVAFIVLFFVIKPVVLDPFLRLMEAREQRTEGAKTEARQMDERAGEIIKRHESELEKVRRAASQELERLRSEGQKLESHVLEEARQQTAQIVLEGKERIGKEADGFRADLRQSVSALAADIASRVLGREVRG